ncbi:tetraspanin-18-like isoform X2 [Haliotis cracherodii]|uniref:tetraspanin-18-like isoform X2 n=1 Tax=Haliotis cracherodii TaxID=6455 RepID=UPI0039EBD141
MTKKTGVDVDPKSRASLLGPTGKKPLRRRRSSRENSDDYKAKRVRRQNDGNCTMCLRGTLHCYNVCILVIGCASLGVGVWLLVTDFGARKVTPIVDNQLYEVTTYLLIAGGGAVALLAFCGCCGTIREDKCVLSFYGTTLAIVLIILGVASGLSFFFRGALASHIKSRMRDTLTEKYGIGTRTLPEHKRITEAWDSMQRQLGCCGISGNSTSTDSWAFYSTNTLWYNEMQNDQGKKLQKVPDSCCREGDKAICTGQTYFPGPPNHLNPQKERFKKTNPHLYTTGCYDQLMVYLLTYSAVAGIVSAIVPIFLIFGIIISFCLCARVSGTSPDDEVEL